MRKEEAGMAKYRCSVCGYIFDEDGNLTLSSPIYSQDILYDFLGMSIKKSKVKKLKK